MSANDNLPRASFDAIEFPFTSRTATLDTRTHVHEFPKMAGGSVEKLGRKLWSFSFDSPFHDSNPFFPNLYPQSLNLLTERCGKLATAVLVVPEIGQIRCILTKIDRRRKGAIKSGEDCTLTFLEDDLEPLRQRSPLAARADLRVAVASFSLYVEPDDPGAPGVLILPPGTPGPSLLDALRSYLAIGDQIELYGARAQAQLDQIKGLVRQTHDLLRPATLDPIRVTLRAIWDAATSIQRDVTGQRQNAVLVPYVVPRTMAVGSIAQSLYGTSARGGEVLALNPEIRDPFAVKVGSRLVVHAA